MRPAYFFYWPLSRKVWPPLCHFLTKWMAHQSQTLYVANSKSKCANFPFNFNLKSFEEEKKVEEILESLFVCLFTDNELEKTFEKQTICMVGGSQPWNISFQTRYINDLQKVGNHFYNPIMVYFKLTYIFIVLNVILSLWCLYVCLCSICMSLKKWFVSLHAIQVWDLKYTAVIA